MTNPAIKILEAAEKYREAKIIRDDLLSQHKKNSMEEQRITRELQTQNRLLDELRSNLIKSASNP